MARGVKPDCREHRHVNRVDAFYLSRNPRFGKLLVLIEARVSTKENPVADGCFVEVAGSIEYVHVRKRTKPNLKAVYAIGEKVAAEQGVPSIRRKLHEYLKYL